MKIIRLQTSAQPAPKPSERSVTPYALRLAVSAALACSAPPLYAATCTASNDATLRACITSTSSGDTIDITADITLASPLPFINKNLSFTGNSHTVSGNNAYQVFWVDSGTVSFANLTIANGKAQGGSGGINATGGGGGGGAGLGGGLFVNGGNVSLSNVSFSSNAAQGGSGGGESVADSYGGSGGGGMGGNGANGVPAVMASLVVVAVV